jgi:hypothetical protein
MIVGRLGLGLLFLLVSIPMFGTRARGADALTVESKTVQAGATGVQIRIFLANDSAMRNLVIPLRVRTVSDDGAFITKMAIKPVAGARIEGLLNGISIYNGYLADSASACKVPFSDPPVYIGGLKAIAWSDTASHAVTTSPVGILVTRGVLFPSEPTLPVGSDGATPSFELLFDIANSPGQFEVDTVCIDPFNHLTYVFTNKPGKVPVFTKGVVTVACAKGLPVPSGPTPTDGALDQLDSVILGWSPITDSCGVPVSSYDVLIGNNCSGLDPVVACTGTDADSCTVTGLNSNTSYFWKIRLTDFMGRQIDGPCWTFKTGNTAVQYLGGDGIPRAYSLDQNYPNPFNTSTVIRFNIKHDGHVRLDVFNILGQKVKTLVDEYRHLGPQAADWDGTDAVGRVVPTGLYFYRLVTSDYTGVKKMVLLK